MKSKKILALLVIIAICFSVPEVAFANEVINNNESEYLEYHYQVNFDDLEVFVINGTTLDVTLSNNMSPRINIDTVNAIDALMVSLSECSDVEEEIVTMLNDNQQLAAISFTEAPLLYEDGHYERVLAAAETTSASSSSNGKGKFTMYTSVSRSYSTNADGTYTYTTKTMGSWSQNSSSGGSDYPQGAEDFILQSTPNTWTRKSHTMSATYDNVPSIGKEGTEFWAMDGGANYMKYAIEDDPYDFAIARQNKSFTLSCVSEGNKTTSARMINSYYIHTWTDITISVSVSVNSDKEVALEITPSKVANNWQVYNYITFNF